MLRALVITLKACRYLAVVLLFCGLCFVQYEPAQAAVTHPWMLEGGRTVWMVPCTCGSGILLYVAGPRPGAFMWYPPPATRTYLFHNIAPPALQKGKALKTLAPCVVVSPHSGCHVEGMGFPLIQTGTSLI